jgi:hypothetical protein
MAVVVRGKNPGQPYTVRYFHENRQRERSFRSKREADEFNAKFEHDSREHSFTDPVGSWSQTSGNSQPPRTERSTAIADEIIRLALAFP